MGIEMIDEKVSVSFRTVSDFLTTVLFIYRNLFVKPYSVLCGEKLDYIFPSF